MDDDPHEYKRNYFSISDVFQSARLQRIIRRYNEAHTLFLVYVADILFNLGPDVFNLFSSEEKGEEAYTIDK